MGFMCHGFAPFTNGDCAAFGVAGALGGSIFAKKND